MASAPKPTSLEEVDSPAPTAVQSIECSLTTLEKLDRSSPELWPELIPGVTDYYKPMAQRAPQRNKSTIQELEELWNKDLDESELVQLRKYSNMTRATLIAKIREIHDVVYELGLQESKEMTRGRMLEIFDTKRQRPS